MTNPADLINFDQLNASLDTLGFKTEAERRTVDDMVIAKVNQGTGVAGIAHGFFAWIQSILSCIGLSGGFFNSVSPASADSGKYNDLYNYNTNCAQLDFALQDMGGKYAENSYQISQTVREQLVASLNLKPGASSSLAGNNVGKQVAEDISSQSSLPYKATPPLTYPR